MPDKENPMDTTAPVFDPNRVIEIKVTLPPRKRPRRDEERAK